MTVKTALQTLQELVGDTKETYGISFSSYFVNGGQQVTRYYCQIPGIDRHDVNAWLKQQGRTDDQGWHTLDEMMQFIEETLTAKAGRNSNAVDATSQIDV